VLARPSLAFAGKGALFLGTSEQWGVEVFVRVLGAVAVGESDSSMQEPPGQVPAAVLAHLALARGHVLTPDALADRVWDDPPDNPRNALQAAVSRLRKAFFADIVESSRAGYRIDVTRVRVDVVEAERAEQQARAAVLAGDPERAMTLAGHGLDLFHGEPLAGLDSLSARAARVNADDLRQRLVALRADGLLATGRAGAAVALLREVCAAAPLAEPAHGQLMRALTAAGRPSDALTVFDGLRRRLADELGSDPSPEVAGIFAAILAGEYEPPAATVSTKAERVPRPAVTVSAPHDVGIVLTDVVGSTRRWAEHPELMPAAMLAHHEAVAEVVGAHGGRLPPDQGEGESRLAVFPSAALAVRAAGSLQQRLSSLDWPGGVRLKVRMGVTAGSVVEADGNIFGSPVNRCARVRGLAHGEQVLVTGVAAALSAEQLDPGCRLTRLGRVSLRDFDEDEEVFQLDWPGGPKTFPPLRTSIRLPTDVASFVGRSAEMHDLGRDVSSHRLVTLTGIGGSGKTRLSVQVARLVAVDFPGGVTFVDLAAAMSVSDAYESVLAALNITAPASADGLRGQVEGDSLLVLDNLEQIKDVGSFVAGILDATSARILATSRLPVGLPGECVRPIAPLSERDALLLLRSRAEDAAPGVELAGATAERLLHLLDGVPLAIELAAARLRVLDPGALADSLDAALSLLVDTASGRPARHRAVEALLDDAWVQQSDSGRRILAVLGLSRAPVPAGTVIDVTGLDAVTVLDTLQVLVSQGLVQSRRRAEGAPAFTVLELVRRLALQHIAPDDFASLRTVHTTVVLNEVLRHPRAAFLQSRDDVHAALRFAIDGEANERFGLTLSSRVALGRAALAQGWWTETIGLLDPVSRSMDAANPLGVALIRRAETGDVDRGRRLLAKAAKAGDVDAACALGGSHRASDPRKAHDWYLKALDLDESDPYALGNVLEFEVRAAQSLVPVEPRRAQLAAAVRRREEQAKADEDLPWPWFDLAKFELLLGQDLIGLHRLLDAVATSSHARQLDSTLVSLRALALPTSSPAWAQAAETLRVASRVRFPESRVERVLGRIAPPVLVLVGASAATRHDEVMTWLEPLSAALSRTAGTVVSGGTAQGVSALAAALAEEVPDWRSLGFAPALLPDGVVLDDRYDEIQQSEGAGFSILEPLSYWDAFADAGLDPVDVHVLGIGGTDLTHLELHTAAALGACVAVTGSSSGIAPAGDAFVGWSALSRVEKTEASLRTWLFG